jgi:hypothetical protein
MRNHWACRHRWACIRLDREINAVVWRLASIVLEVHRFALLTLHRLLQRVLAMPIRLFVVLLRLDHEAEEQF